MSYIHLRHQVIGAKWNEERSKWTVTIRKLDETDTEGQAIEIVDECDVLLNGGGFLKYVISNQTKERQDETYCANGH